MKKKLIVLYMVSAISGLLANMIFWAGTVMYGIVISVPLFATGCVITPVALACALWSIHNLINLIKDKEQP